MSEPATAALRAFLDPASIAVIGATEDSNRIGGRAIHYMARFGYRGAVYPVNPRRDRVQGLRCYPDAASLPQAPDLALVAVSGELAPGALEDCARRGIRAAVVMSSGFGETGAAGRERERALVQLAARHGMRLIGPNSQGIANFRSGAVTSFSTMFSEVPPADGPVAIISQSGAASVMPYALLRERGIGVRYVIATGNDADLTVSDTLRAAVEDREVRLVLLYLEAIRDADGLAAAAEFARARGTAVVALKAGASAKGQRAASSHTGALATEDSAVGAFFRRHGIWRVHDIADLANAAPLYLGGRATGAGRLLVMSHSGAVGVVCADSAERIGLPLPDLEPDTARKLQALMPSFGTAQNPVDLTAALLGDSSLFGKALDVLAGDANMDLVQIGMPVAGQGYDLEGFARSAAEVAGRVGKPMVVSGPQRPVLEFFSKQGLPTFQSDTEALRALKQYAAHRELLAEAPPRAPAPAGAKLEAGLAGVLSEAESLRLLAQAGIPVVEHRECRSIEEALRAFRDIGRRCVLKACSREVPHKSEHNLVWLALDSEARIEAAYRACEAKLGALGVRGTVLVAEMRSGRRELVVGARRDPTFGPLLVVGDGGKYVEALKDHELLCAPVSEDEVARALARLRIWPILAGMRGEAPADTAALGRAAAALGNLLLALPRIESVDMNPVMVGAAGEGVRVLDALVTIR